MKTIRILAALCFASLTGSALAGEPVITATTIPLPAIVAAGLTYQQLLPQALSGSRNSLTIQNNNATDNCEIIVGGPWQVGDTTTTSRTINGASVTGAKASILLQPGISYQRYYPIIPSDQILGTCTTTGDSIYVDTQ